MKRQFTLIEVVAAILVISILCAIILIETLDFRKKAVKSSISQNIAILQGSVDTYYLKNETYPTLDGSNIKISEPQKIDIERLVREGYVKKDLDISKIKNQHYWVDAFGAVWGSTVDNSNSTTFFNYKEGNRVEFKGSDNIVGFSIYEVSGYEEYASITDGLSASVNNEKSKKVYKKIQEFKLSATNKDAIVQELKSDKYLISFTDEYGLETAPIGKNYSSFDSIIKGSGEYIYEIENTRTMIWLGFKELSLTPGASKVAYEFQVKDEKGVYGEWTKDFLSLEKSKGIRVKSILTADEAGNKPSVLELRVLFKFEDYDAIYLNPQLDDVYKKNVICTEPHLKSTINEKGEGENGTNKGVVAIPFYIPHNENLGNLKIPQVDFKSSFKINDIKYYLANDQGIYEEIYGLDIVLSGKCVIIVYDIEVTPNSELVCGAGGSMTNLTGKEKTFVFSKVLSEGEVITQVDANLLFPNNYKVLKFYVEYSQNGEYFKVAENIAGIPTPSCVNLVYIVLEEKQDTIPNCEVDCTLTPTCVGDCSRDGGPNGPVKISTGGGNGGNGEGSTGGFGPITIYTCKSDCIKVCSSCGGNPPPTSFPPVDKCTVDPSSCGESVPEWCQLNPLNCNPPPECIDGKCKTNPPVCKNTCYEEDSWKTVDTMRFFAEASVGEKSKWIGIEKKDFTPENTRIVYMFSKSNGSYWSEEFKDISEAGYAERLVVNAYLQIKKDKIGVEEQEEPSIDWVRIISDRDNYLVETSKPQAIIIPIKDNNKRSNKFSDTSNINWEFGYIDNNGFKLKDIEWRGDVRRNYNAGDYIIELRVMNDRNIWSNWTSYQLTVYPDKPVAVIDVNPNEAEINSPVQWTYINSYDPDGDHIVDLEWKGDKRNSYDKVGDYTVSLRVKDEEGNWSNWIEKTLKVKDDWSEIANSKSINISYDFGELVKVSNESKIEITPTNTNLKYSFYISKTGDDNFKYVGDSIPSNVEFRYLQLVVNKISQNGKNYLSEPNLYKLSYDYTNSKGELNNAIIYDNISEMTYKFKNFGNTAANFIVPSTGYYTFDIMGARGGKGGDGYYSYQTASPTIPKGSKVSATIKLNEGDIVTVYQGLMGGTGGQGKMSNASGRTTTFSGGGGGGGGASVVLINNTISLVAAGGNGGNGFSTSAVSTNTNNTATIGIGGASLTSYEGRNSISRSHLGGTGGGSNLISSTLIKTNSKITTNVNDARGSVVINPFFE